MLPSDDRRHLHVLVCGFFDSSASESRLGHERGTFPKVQKLSSECSSVRRAPREATFCVGSGDGMEQRDQLERAQMSRSFLIWKSRTIFLRKEYTASSREPPGLSSHAPFGLLGAPGLDPSHGYHHLSWLTFIQSYQSQRICKCWFQRLNIHL